MSPWKFRNSGLGDRWGYKDVVQNLGPEDRWGYKDVVLEWLGFLHQASVCCCDQSILTLQIREMFPVLKDCALPCRGVA